MRLKPILSWPGGKSRHLSDLLPYVPEFNTYYEPFLGGGSVFLALQPKKAIVGDLNWDTINIFKCVRDQVSEFKEIIKNYAEIAKNKDHAKIKYGELLNLDKSQEFSNLTAVERAARYLFLNKMSYKSMLKTVKNGELRGMFHDVKNFRPDLDNIDNISLYLNNNDVKLCVSDFSVSAKDAQRGDFVFLDPPYYNKYENYNPDGFTEDIQRRLCEFIEELNSNGVKFLFHNATDPYTRLYRRVDFTLIYMNNASNALSAKLGKKQSTMYEILLSNVTI